jgi:3-isopropylmalate/(R)-2-methylmalate dehydratase small subunit
VALLEEEVDALFREAEGSPEYQLTVDLENQTVAGAKGVRFAFKIDPFRRDCLLKGLDDIGLTLRFEDNITAYEEAHHPAAVRYQSIEPNLT